MRGQLISRVLARRFTGVGDVAALLMVWDTTEPTQSDILSAAALCRALAAWLTRGARVKVCLLSTAAGALICKYGRAGGGERTARAQLMLDSVVAKKNITSHATFGFNRAHVL